MKSIRQECQDCFDYMFTISLQIQELRLKIGYNKS